MPLSWSVILYKEQMTDYLRFRKFQDFAANCSDEASVFTAVSEEHKGCLPAVVHSCVGEQLGSLLPSPAASQKKGKKKDAEESLCLAVTALLESKLLPEASLEDLQLLQRLWTDSSSDLRLSAEEKLGEMLADAEYWGILRPMLHSEFWSNFVTSLQRPAKTSSAAADVRKAFDVLNSVIAGNADSYTDEQRESLSQALLKAARVPQPGVQAHVTSVLNGLAAVSKQTASQQISQTKLLCKAVVQKGLAELDFDSMLAMSDEYLRRGCWDELEDEVSLETTADGDTEQAEVEERQSSLKALLAAGEALMKQRRVFEAVLFATKAAQRFEDTKEDEDKNSFLLKWSKLKTLQQTGEQTSELIPAVSQQIEELLVAIRIPEIGPSLHVAAMEKFSAKLALLLLEACKDCKDSAAVAAAAAAVMDAQHETMQSCALCDTPSFARSCVEFACSEMVPVMQTAFLLTDTDLSADSQSVTDFLHSHLRAVCDLEQNKQRVMQVLETPDAESFLERAATLQKKVAPVLASKLQTLRAEVDKTLTVLQEQLVPSSVTNEDFLRQSLSGDALKKLLKACVKAEKNLAKASAIEEDMATRLATTKSAARAQITTWGVLTIMAEGDLQAQNKKGTDFRAALKEIWGEHKKMLASRLGPEMSKQVTDTIAGTLIVQPKGEAEQPGEEQPRKSTKRKAATQSTGSRKRA